MDLPILRAIKLCVDHWSAVEDANHWTQCSSRFMEIMKKLKCVNLYCKDNDKALSTTAQWFSDKLNTVNDKPS